MVKLPRRLFTCSAAEIHNMVRASYRGARALPTPYGLLTYVNRGAKILGVAHTDVVSRPPYKFVVGKTVIQSISLDDRLGVWALLYALRDLPYDILLTDCEEIGRSTAEYFAPHKRYNWCFQLDRRGSEDAALYQYIHTPEWKRAVEATGLEAVAGTYTDIAALRIGVCAVNFPIGYQNAHREDCRAELTDIEYCLRIARQFIREHADKRYEEEPPPKEKEERWWWHGWRYG